MANVECPFCHKRIPEREIAAHIARHREDRGDGQQRDYATLRPEQRDKDELRGVPQVYMHLKCRTGTGMPEEIIRTYLVDPWFYNSDRTFCCGCSTHVPLSECVWTETGENVQQYMNKLRAAYDRSAKLREGIAPASAAEPPSMLSSPKFWLWIVAAVFIGCILLAMFGQPPRR
jgi:hypothetical protein